MQEPTESIQIFFLNDSPLIQKKFEEVSKKKLKGSTSPEDSDLLFPDTNLTIPKQNFLFGLSSSGLPPRRKEDNFVLPFFEEGISPKFEWKSGEVYSCDVGDSKSIKEFFSVYRSYWHFVDEIYYPFPWIEFESLSGISFEDWESQFVDKLTLQFLFLREVYPLLATAQKPHFHLLIENTDTINGYLTSTILDLFRSFQKEWSGKVEVKISSLVQMGDMLLTKRWLRGRL